MTTFLGIDPGLAKTGYGIIQISSGALKHVTHGTISTESSVPTGDRLKEIHTKVRKLIKTYKPDIGGVESLYFAKNITSAIPVAQARGVVLLAFSQEKTEAKEFPPQEIKQAITGNGRAEKQQVQELVKFLLSLDDIPRSDHAADALAVAICCYHSYTADEIVRKAQSENRND